MARKSNLKPNSYSQATQMISVFDDPPRKNVLLLSCMDQRLLDDTVKFMNRLNLHNRYDQVALAGGAMGALNLPDPKLPESKRWQGVFQTHLDAAINVLHRPIKDIFLLDHLDCGAYKYLHPDLELRESYRESSLCEMIPFHQNELSRFAAEVKQFIDYQLQLAKNKFNEIDNACETQIKDKHQKEESICWNYASKTARDEIDEWSNIRVSYFIMDLLGNVRQLDVPDEQSDTFPC